MKNELSVVIAAEFSLSEKIAEFLAQSELTIEKLQIAEIYPFSEEQGIRFQNKAVVQKEIDEINWGEVNYLFFAGDSTFAEHLIHATQGGCVVIDLLGVCASLADVPVVVPTVNEGGLSELRQRHIVSLPDPQVTQLALAIAPLARENISQVLVTSLLPASYVGQACVEKLAGQTAQLLNGIPLDEGLQRLAFDVFPLQGKNLNAQLQKIYPQLTAHFHSVQTPVFYGMAQKVTALSEYGDIDTAQIISQWEENPLLAYEPDTLPTPVTNGESEEGIPQLHLQQLSAVENGMAFWSVCDEQRFALAYLAVRLAELIYTQGY